MFSHLKVTKTMIVEDGREIHIPKDFPVIKKCTFEYFVIKTGGQRSITEKRCGYSEFTLLDICSVDSYH